jgi:hypothetical protein
MKHLIFIFLFIFAICNLNATPIRKATSFYISNKGDDSNLGNKNAPFKSIAKINSIEFIGGDSVFLESAHEFQGTLKISKFYGKEKLYISSLGKEKAILNGLNGIGLLIDSSENIIVNNILVLGNGRKNGNNNNGIAILFSKKISINDCLVKGFQKSGIYVFCSENIKTEKCIAQDNGAAGIFVDGVTKKSSRYILIKSCKAINNPGDPTNFTNHSGNGILVGLCTSVKIDHCEAYENGWDMPRIGNGPVGIWTYESDSVIIQNCISHHNKTSAGGSDGGGFDLDGGVTNSIIQNCNSYQNEGAGYGIYQYAGASKWENNIIRNCTSTNDGLKSGGKAAIYIWNSSEDEEQFKKLRFEHNTIINKNGVAIRFDILSKHQSFIFSENTIQSKDSLIAFAIFHEKDNFKNNKWTSMSRGKINLDASLMQQVIAKITDQIGNRINAHGASILFYKGMYYLYGEVKKGDTWLVPNQSWECFRVSAGGIACYSSLDCKKWKFNGVVLKPTIGIENSALDTSKVIERPRVIYNQNTKKFVMWIHLDNNVYSAAQVGVAVSNNPIGPFHLVSNFKPNNEDSRDMTVFKDENGKAYLYNSSENNNTIHVNELTDDYLQVKPQYERILINQRRESPTVFKYQNLYYLITSLCTGWSPNEALIAVSKSPMGPWESKSNPCIGTNANVTYGSQISHILFDQTSNKMIGISDVWDKTNLKNSNYIFLPISFKNDRVEIVASSIY